MVSDDIGISQLGENYLFTKLDRSEYAGKTSPHIQGNKDSL